MPEKGNPAAASLSARPKWLEGVVQLWEAKAWLSSNRKTNLGFLESWMALRYNSWNSGITEYGGCMVCETLLSMGNDGLECLNRSYELLHCERNSMLHGRSFSEIFGFQIAWPFLGFVHICCLVNVVVQNLALPMDWTSGLKGLYSCSVRTTLAGCGVRAGSVVDGVVLPSAC